MRRAVMVILAVSAVCPAAPLAASRIPAPRAPQNPFLAANPDSNIHNDTWMTNTYARGGPTGRSLVTASGPLPLSLCSAMLFDPLGHIITLCPSPVGPSVVRVIAPSTLTVLGSYVLPDAPSPPGTKAFQNFTGGGYFFLDRRGRVWTATKTNHLFVLAPSSDGHTVTKVADYNLTSAVRGN
jgi:hypothetical protein